MTLLELENGAPKQILLGSKEVEATLLQALNKALSQYGNLMSIEKLQTEQVFDQTVYVITLETEDDCQ